jgi:hypothetical protein
MRLTEYGIVSTKSVANSIRSVVKLRRTENALLNEDWNWPLLTNSDVKCCKEVSEVS